jgi:hypothetical protein
MRTPNVKDLSIGLLDNRGVNPFDCVADIRKGPGLESVAMDWELVVVQHGIDKRCLGPAPPAEVMARPIGTEKTQHGDRDVKALLVGKSLMLFEQFGHGIAPASHLR